ncbi:MAG: DUF2933 domain-containing protein [Chloroflexi bacterium]|nr:DUF2933 domain-containing protein [Chloroflexota bacterium]
MNDIVAFVQQNGATVVVVGLMVLMHVFGFGHGGHGQGGHGAQHSDVRRPSDRP